MRKTIGQIMMVSYLTGGATPHLEFEIFQEEYKRRGIMSEEVKKYLKFYKKYKHNNILYNI